jgi:hypothetical protein
MTPEQFTFQGMTSRQWAYKIIHESAGGPRNLGKLLREFAEAYAKHCVEQAERDKKVGCPSCGVAFTVQGEDLFRGEKAYALLERAEAADLKLAQMREALETLPLSMLNKAIEDIDAAEFVDNAEPFINAMIKARRLLAES